MTCWRRCVERPRRREGREIKNRRESVRLPLRNLIPILLELSFQQEVEKEGKDGRARCRDEAEEGDEKGRKREVMEER